MNAYSIGLSALTAGSRGLDVIGHNIANANTPGYHRRRVALAGLTVDGRTGVGVEVQRIVRAEAAAVRSALRTADGDLARIGARLDVQLQAESVLAPGAGSLGERMERFFNQVEQLTARPEDPALRRLVLTAAADLAGQFNAAAGGLDRLRAATGEQVNDAVARVNDLTPRIAELNTRISAIEVQGGAANDLRDQRDQLINELSGLVELRTIEQPNGAVTVLGPGAALVAGGVAGTLAVAADANGQLVVTASGAPTALAIRGGRLGGLLEEYNTALPGYRARLDVLARGLAGAVNAVHATGLAGGPSTFVAGTQRVANPTAALATAGLPFPVQAGTVAVSVTELATGRRTLQRINLNPATQSLQDVAAALTAGTGGQVQATVDAATNTLRFQAQAGYAFDFAGRLPTEPTAVAMNGTAVPSVAGQYTGAGNDTYRFSVLGSGTVGVTAGLQLQVRDAANTVIATLDVGAGYTPGTALAVANGVTVSLSAGTSANGTFEAPVTGQPDTTGLLAALGVNGLFTGGDAATVAVRADLLADPAKLAVGRTGRPGDATNLERLAALRDQTLMAGGTQSFARYHDALVGDIGSEVASLSDHEAAQDGLRQALFAQEQAVVGVDLNEESVRLIEFQRMVETAARYLDVVNGALDAVLEMVR